jgi:hypothetical protein
VTGNQGTTVLTAAEHERLQPRSVELDMLVRGMLERATQDEKIAWDCLGRLHRALEKAFDLKHKLQIKEEYEAVVPGPAPGSQPYYHHYKN